MKKLLTLQQCLLVLLALSLLTFGSCDSPSDSEGESETSSTDSTPKDPKPIMEPLKLDLQGHRGARGLLPENTIPAMERALELGMNTLEMDVVITRDNQVVLSHEPFMSHEICLDPEGNPISEEAEKTHNIYEMDYATVVTYDCGTKIHPRFPEAERMPATKPLLSEVIDAAEAWGEKQMKLPYYNIEIKRVEGQDGIFHPDATEFAELVIKVVSDKGIVERVCLQSFDIATLEEIHTLAPEMTVAYLVESEVDFQNALGLLSYSPQIYSPYFELVNPDLMAHAKAQGMKVIPWTVNEEQDMRAMIEMGVDGIISDYPGRLAKAAGL